MPSLTRKFIRGRPYYYARWCQRVDGRPKIVRTLYLGSLDNIVQAVETAQQPLPPKEAKVASFASQPIMLIVQPVRVRRWKMTMNHLEITDLGDRGDPAQASSVVKVLTGAGRANDQAVA